MTPDRSFGGHPINLFDIRPYVRTQNSVAFSGACGSQQDSQGLMSYPSLAGTAPIELPDLLHSVSLGNFLLKDANRLFHQCKAPPAPIVVELAHFT